MWVPRIAGDVEDRDRVVAGVARVEEAPVARQLDPARERRALDSHRADELDAAGFVVGVHDEQGEVRDARVHEPRPGEGDEPLRPRELVRPLLREDPRRERERRSGRVRQRAVRADPEGVEEGGGARPRSLLVGAQHELAVGRDECLRGRRAGGRGLRRADRCERSRGRDLEGGVVRYLVPQVAHSVVRLVRDEQMAAPVVDAAGRGPLRRERRSGRRGQRAVVGDPEDGDRVRPGVDGEQQLVARADRHRPLDVERARVRQVVGPGAAGRVLGDLHRARRAAAVPERDDRVRVLGRVVRLDVDRAVETACGRRQRQAGKDRRQRDGEHALHAVTLSDGPAQARGMRESLRHIKGLIALAALAMFAALAPAAAAGPAAPLNHAGRWTTDKSGHVVVLHGLNMVSKLAPYAPDATGFGDDDAAFLAAEGLNTGRAGVIYKAVEPQPGVYDDTYLQRIENTVQTLGRHGIFALIDFHQDLYNERFQGEGWPDWAVQDDGLPAQPQAGFPGNYLAMPALQHAFDHFWANDPGPGGVGLQDRYAAAWRHVAERFRDNPSVLGYDLLNEPWPGTTWQQCANPAGCPEFDARMSGFVARTLGAIRQSDPDTLVFYEPNVLFNNGADTHLADTGDAHAAMSFHDYCLTASEGGQGYGNCGRFDDLVFANADKRAQNTGDALLLTEFGATDARDVLLGVLERADRAMVGWQEWHYCGCADPTTSGPGDKQAIVRDPNKPPAGDNLVKGTLQ